MKLRLSVALIASLVVSCADVPLPPPAVLSRGGVTGWNGKYTFWDRNADGKPDRIRNYWGSGAAREYFDDDFDGSWDGAESIGGGKLATGLKEKRDPKGLDEQDHENIASALQHCVSAKKP